MTRVKITNSIDLDEAARGVIGPESIRSVEVEALVDTGATMLALPEDVVAPLGVPVIAMRKVRDSFGKVVDVPRVGNLRIEILGRDMTTDAVVLPRGATPLIGQIPLEALDLQVDPKSRELRLNPESPDVPLLDLMYVA